MASYIPAQEVVNKQYGQFETELKQALAGVFPTGTPYKDVIVIIVTWSTTPTHIPLLEEAIQRLEYVLGNHYHFGIRRISLKTSTLPHLIAIHFSRDLGLIMDLLGPEDLVILYYGGHGEVGPNRELILLFVSCYSVINSTLTILFRADQGRGGQPEMNFTIAMRQSLEIAPNHVIYFLDCCHSDGAGLNLNREMLTACSAEWPASGGISSFTRHLAETLEAQHPIPITVAHLHQKLFQECWIGQGLGGGNIGLVTTPLHLELNRHQQGSLVIAPLSRPSPSKYTNLPSVERPLLGDNPPKVLMTVRLARNTKIPSVEGWKRWLSTFLPPFIKDIDIEAVGAFQGSSIIVMLTVPVAVFSVLARPGRGYRGIEVVMSVNLLVRAPAATITTATIPLRGENIKPGSSKK